MARIDNLTNFLVDVSAAIKRQLGDNTPIAASQFDTKILAIPTKENYQTKSITIRQDGNVSLLPDQGYGAMDRVDITVDTTSRKQSKNVNIISNGQYDISADEGYDALSNVHLEVDVQATGDEQHMPFYLLESGDDGNLYCINNYSELLYVPYSLDTSGNLIVTQDDDDTAVYSMNTNQELEVVV